MKNPVCEKCGQPVNIKNYYQHPTDAGRHTCWECHQVNPMDSLIETVKAGILRLNNDPYEIGVTTQVAEKQESPKDQLKMKLVGFITGPQAEERARNIVQALLPLVEVKS